MDRLSLQAEERIILGKKVKKLRESGKLPAHVFGKGLESEHVSVDGKTFLQTFAEAGETGLIDLKIGTEKVRPVMVREVQYDPVSGDPVHIDFYQVNLAQKVKVPVPLEMIGEQPESVKLGETIVLQTLNEVEVEALPTDLIEKIEVDITSLQNIDDAITVGQLKFDRSKLTVQAADEEIVVKLAPAVSAEMEKLLEEQAAETAAVAAEAGAEAAAEGGVEGAAPAEGEAPAAENQIKTEGADTKEEAAKE
ncbi:MAG: 50S ribosomal protein L25 [Candidatus Daviesbacteria bacterium GW2011_GWF2_38_7]|nr:MAG: 50S ribosomal protein L25 [Candidatus Daviesbacteria bacterium GW2011_GWF2_38_7]